MLKMSDQLSFELPFRVATGRTEYFLSAANQMAVATIDDLASWPQRKMMVLGPESCGKSHLLDIWISDNAAQKFDPLAVFDLPEPGANIVLDDLQNIAGILPAETRLFHLHNHLQSTGGALLMASSLPVTQAGFQLPDLLSRLQGTACTRIEAPDDDLLHAVLLKNFMDRQLSPTPTIIAYILKNMDRTFIAASELVTELDAQSMASKRPIGRKMVADILSLKY